MALVPAPAREELLARHVFVKRAMDLAGAGLSVVPMADLATKKPGVQWAQYQKRAALPATVGRWFDQRELPGVAIVTGYNGVFCIDADQDHDGGTSHAVWALLVEASAPGLLARMVQERSRSGGLHYWARCAAVGKGRDLAFAADGRVVFEYKGAGRLCVCAPTPGYEVLSGDLARLPEIEREEHDALVEAAEATNARYDPSRKGGRHFTSAGRPGADYAAKAPFGDVLALLTGAGWKVTSGGESEGSAKLERPGKDERSTGGDLATVDGAVLFYCYTSSAAPFEPMSAYNAFQVRTMALYGDAAEDWQRSARELAAQGYGERASGGAGGGEGEEDPDGPRPDQLDCADRFATEMGERWTYDGEGHGWRQWVGTHWQAATGAEESALRMAMARLIRGFGRRSVQSYGQVTSALSLAEGTCYRDFERQEDGTAKTGLVAFANGTLDGDALREARREDNIRICTGYDYAAGESFPRIERFLEESIPDPGGRDSFACHLGLALLGDRTFHKALVLVGGKNSGKSTLYKLANLVCGNERSSGPGGALFGDDLEAMRSRATWNHRLLVAIDELPPTALKHEDITKAMLAHSGVPMRRLQQSEQLDNSWGPKVVFTANEDPRTTDATGALARRLLYIRVPNAREDADPTIDRRLIDKLEAELGAFAAHCLAMAGAAIAAGMYPESAGMAAYSAKVEIESDALKAFVTYRCVIDDAGFVATDTLHQHYVGYCLENGHTGQLSMIRMVKRVLDRYGHQHNLVPRTRVPEGKKLRARGLLGIRLRTATDPECDTGWGETEDVQT